MRHRVVPCRVLVLVATLASAGATAAETPAPPAYDAARARQVGADSRGMRPYVLVILKTGPRPLPDDERRRTLFAGHFANIERLAKAGKLVLAGPFADDPGQWRGLFLLATDDLDEARRLTESDPIIQAGELAAEYHRWYGSAAAMLLPELHRSLVAPPADGPRP